MTPKVKSASLEIEFSGKKKLISALASSLEPEVINSRRLTFSLGTKNDGRTLWLKFKASDVVSLRAGMNTILRLLLSALKSIQAATSAKFDQNPQTIQRKTE